MAQSFQGTVNLILSFKKDEVITLAKTPSSFIELEKITEAMTGIRGVQWDFYSKSKYGNDTHRIDIINETTLKQAYDRATEQGASSIDLVTNYDASAIILPSQELCLSF